MLVGIEGGDALLGGAVLLVLQAGLLQPIQFPVPGKQQGSPVADFQVLRGNTNPLALHILDLFPQVFRIQSNPVSENVDYTLVEDT